VDAGAIEGGGADEAVGVADLAGARRCAGTEGDRAGIILESVIPDGRGHNYAAAGQFDRRLLADAIQRGAAHAAVAGVNPPAAKCSPAAPGDGAHVAKGHGVDERAAHKVAAVGQRRHPTAPCTIAGAAVQAGGGGERSRAARKTAAPDDGAGVGVAVVIPQMAARHIVAVGEHHCQLPDAVAVAAAGEAVGG
jgi:hypothetical protein